jgi:hypothetical protein
MLFVKKSFAIYHNPVISKSNRFRNARIIYFHKIENIFRRFLGLSKLNLSFTLVNHNRGFFSLLFGFVDLVEYSSQFNLQPNIFVENINYASSGEDIFESLFLMSYRTNRNECNRNITFQAPEELPFFRHKTSKVDLSRAQKIVREYLQVSQMIDLKLGNFLQFAKGERFIGIHWRGTDHTAEADPTEVEQIAKRLDYVIKSEAYNSIRKIFIATDEKTKLLQLHNFLIIQYPEFQIFFTNSTRSTSNLPIHIGIDTSSEDMNLLGEEALLDCLVL